MGAIHARDSVNYLCTREPRAVIDAAVTPTGREGAVENDERCSASPVRDVFILSSAADKK